MAKFKSITQPEAEEAPESFKVNLKDTAKYNASEDSEHKLSHSNMGETNFSTPSVTSNNRKLKDGINLQPDLQVKEPVIEFYEDYPYTKCSDAIKDMITLVNKGLMNAISMINVAKTDLTQDKGVTIAYDYLLIPNIKIIITKK